MDVNQNTLSALPSWNNKLPPEGPRFIPLSFAFTVATEWSVDLMQLQQQGKISTLQAFYIDNSTNTAPVTITMGLGGQVITLAAGQQAYMTCLINNVPKFTVSSTGSGANVFALNFPVTNAVW
jgi:hypothetical protein